MMTVFSNERVNVVDSSGHEILLRKKDYHWPHVCMWYGALNWALKHAGQSLYH